MEKLSEKELLKLYFEFIRYRDEECDGMAQISVKDFYLRGLRNGKQF